MRTLRPGTDQLLRDTSQISVEDYPMRRLDEVENPALAGRALPGTLDEHPIIKPVTV
jgi:putative NADH-flavin reductase